MPALKAPFWMSPWSRGIENGRPYRGRMIAASRAERKKRHAEIRIYDDVVAKMTPAQVEEYVSLAMREAIVKIGLLPAVTAAAKVAMLNGWDPQAKTKAPLIAATR